jgi:O-antigen ligase
VLATSPAIALRACSLELAVTVLFLTGRAGGARARTLLLASVVLAALGVALVALAEGFGLLRELSRAGRTPGSTLGQRNMVAHLLALALPGAWWLAATGRHAALCWLGALGSACLPAALVLTRSRAGWLAGSAALLSFVPLWCWQTRTSGSRERLAIGLPLVCSVGAVLLVCLLPVRLAWNTSTPYADTLSRLGESETGSGAGRLAQQRASLELVALHPWLGAGPGNWMVEYPRVAPARELARRGHGFLHTGRLPNSDWIALLTERGLVAALCALALGVAVCLAARAQTWLAPVGATACALLVVGALDAVLQLPAPACLVALLFACGAPRKPASRAFAAVSRLLSAGLCLLLVGTTWGATQRALGLWARTRPGGGFAAMESAVRCNGADLFARFMLAEAYVLKGDCTHARPHVAALQQLLPYHRAPRELGCADPR